MRVFLVRHGETETSGKTFAGRSDVALTARGRAQATALAHRLAAEPIALILSSPLSRATDSARPLAAALGRDLVTEPALMEIDFGRHEGQAKGTLGLSLRRAHAHVPVPGGESLHDVWGRAGQVLDGLRAAPLPPGAACAVFGHFWINRLLWGRAQGLTFEAACRSRLYRPKTGEVVELILPAEAPEHAADRA